MSPLVPEAGEWSDLPVSLDDLLPTNPPRDDGPRADAGPEPGPAAPPPSGPPLAAPPPPLAAPPAARREPTAGDRAEIEQLHAEVTATSGASERSPFGTMGRKRLRTAQKAEAEALERLGFASYGDFLAAIGAEGPAAAVGDELPATQPVAPRAHSFATLADLSTRREPDPEPATVDAPEPADSGAELARMQEELQQVRTELTAAHAARKATDDELAGARAELNERASGYGAAQAEAEVARRHLGQTEAELERLRAELAQLTTARFTDEGALERIRAESEQELERMRALAEAEVAELATQLAAFQDDTARATERLERAHREELGAVQSELTTAREVAQRAGSEVTDAVRSRDAAIDELAVHRAEIDKLRGELGATRAESVRMQQDRDALIARATEAEAALGSARADSDLDVSRLDAATKQQEAQIAELEAQLGQASTAANALALAQGDLALVRDELEIARAQLASAYEVADQLGADLKAARDESERGLRELEAARTELDAARTARDGAGSELDAMRVEVSTLRILIEDLESRATPASPVDGPTEDLRRLVEVAQQLASGTADDHRPLRAGAARSRDQAEQELADLEARVVKLRSKRRRMKRRLEAGRTQLRDVREAVAREIRDGEADRARIRQETEALAARIALETASALDEAVRERHAAHLARRAAIEHAGAELAALEAGVETVAIDADALRSKLASIRTELLESPGPDPSDPR